MDQRKIEHLKPVPTSGGVLYVGDQGTIIFEAPGLPLQEEFGAIRLNGSSPRYSCSMGVSGTAEQIRQYLADLY